MNTKKTTNKKITTWWGFTDIEIIAITYTVLILAIGFMEVGTNVLDFGVAAILVYGILSIISIMISTSKGSALSVFLGGYCAAINMMVLAFALGWIK